MAAPPADDSGPPDEPTHRQEALHLEGEISAVLRNLSSGINGEELRMLCVGEQTYSYVTMFSEAIEDFKEVFLSREQCARRDTMDSACAERLARLCPNLRELCLGCPVDESGVRTLLSLLPGLTTLDLPKFQSRGDYMSLLPVGLQRLSLAGVKSLQPASFRHLARCNLRELRLDEDRLSGAELTAALEHCPHLERLVVPGVGVPPDSDWTPDLTKCPRLKEMDQSIPACNAILQFLEHDVVVGPETPGLDLAGLTAACPRLERLRIHRARLPPEGCAEMPGLLMLDFCQSDFTETAEPRLAGALSRLTNLQVLCMGYRMEAYSPQIFPRYQLKAASPVFTAIAGLKSLKALACRFRTGADASAMIRCLPSLTAVRLQWIEPDAFRSLMEDLARHPLEARAEVSLIIPNDKVAQAASQQPKYVRVVEDKDGIWESLSGWSQWRKCCCPKRSFATL